MALRANTASPQRDNHPSLLPGLPLFWSDPTKSPAMEWERWFDLFTVAVMAKYSISVEELTRTVDAEHPRVKALSGRKETGNMAIPLGGRTREKDV